MNYLGIIFRALGPATLLAMLLALPAQGVAETAESPRELTLHLWNIPPKGSTNLRDKVDREVFDLFLKRNPHIKVKVLVPLKIQGQAAESNEFMAIAGGTAPDVFTLFGRKVGDYIDQGFLAPLNDRFAADFADQGKAYEGIQSPDKIWELCIREGNIYAVPRSYYFMALMYRKDLFVRAGLDPNRGPADWDEMWAMAKQLTYIPTKEPDAAPDAMAIYGFQLLRGIYQGWHFLQYIWSGGGQVVESYRMDPATQSPVSVLPPSFPYDRYGIRLLNHDHYRQVYADYQEPPGLDDELKWRLVANQPGGVAALEFYRKLALQKWLRCDGAHPGREFDITPEMQRAGVATCPVCGQAYELAKPAVQNRLYEGVTRSSMGTERNLRYDFAMRIGTLEEVTQGLDFSQWNVTVFPPRAGQPVKSFIAGWYWGVNSTSPPERQEAAWQYVKFMTGEEAQEMRVKSLVENGMAQYVRPALLQHYGYEDYYRELPEAWIDLYRRVNETAEVEPYCKGFTHVMTVSLGHPMDMAMLYPDLDAQALLDQTCAEVNATILGKRPERDMRRYRIIAMVLLAVTAVLIAAAFVFVVRSRMNQDQLMPDYIPGVSRLRRAFYAWSFLGIAVGLVALWQYYPLVRGSVMAFQDYKILTGGAFVGVDNFIAVFLDKNFYQFMAQTFIYVFMSIGLGFAVPLVLAVMLSEVPRGKVIFRTLYYLPAVTTGIVTLFLWKELMFDPSPDGALNGMLAAIGIEPLKFLESPALAMVCIIVPGIWAHAGPGCLIYLAALKTIPDEMYEAADLDGAGIWCKFRHVMLPNMKALILINFLGAFVGAFQASENIFVMTGGGPINRTMTTGLYIWYNSFLYLNFGFATALAWVLGAMILGFTVIQLQVLSKVQFQRAGAVKEGK
jgi:ABC-type sugar transport system permease subunit/ABC-type glycerol-3-phosphate transport system substrate-binding protein